MKAALAIGISSERLGGHAIGVVPPAAGQRMACFACIIPCPDVIWGRRSHRYGSVRPGGGGLLGGGRGMNGSEMEFMLLVITLLVIALN